MGYIYLRTNTVNGKKYVGQVITKRFKARQTEWKCLTQEYAGQAINNARAKYGIDAFDFEILKECDDKELNKWEMYYIKELNTKVPYGYNMTDGGNSVCPQSEETKRKKSEKLKGRKRPEEAIRKTAEANRGKHHSEETKKKIRNTLKGRKRPEEAIRKTAEANKGKKRSEEIKKKMSEKAKGRKVSEETKKKLSEINKGKHHSEESKKKISETLKGRKKPPRSEEHKKHLSEAKKNGKLSKPLLQINKYTNEVIAEFPSSMQVTRDLGYSCTHICQCCNGKRKTAYGFKWKYKESVA